MMVKTICVIGYREIPADKLDYVRLELEREINAALEDGYKTFLAEFTDGAGKLFIRLVDARRDDYPNIFLESVLTRERIELNEGELLGKSNGVRLLCTNCQEGYPLSLTRNLVELSRRVIVVKVDDDSDALYAMDYASTLERDLRIIEV